MKKNNDFEFTYFAPSSEERKEIESIKNSYTKKNISSSNKLMRLRKLDRKVKNTPTIVALIFGIIGTLIFGLGMSMILEWNLLVCGILVCVIGVIPISLAYLVYNKTEKYLKNKYTKEILKLSDELLYEEK